MQHDKKNYTYFYTKNCTCFDICVRLWKRKVIYLIWQELKHLNICQLSKTFCVLVHRPPEFWNIHLIWMESFLGLLVLHLIRMTFRMFFGIFFCNSIIHFLTFFPTYCFFLFLNDTVAPHRTSLETCAHTLASLFLSDRGVVTEAKFIRSMYLRFSILFFFRFLLVWMFSLHA